MSPKTEFFRKGFGIVRSFCALEKQYWRRFVHSNARKKGIEENARVNQVGIQYLSEQLHRKVFPKTSPNDYKKTYNEHLLKLAKEHLQHNQLLGKKTSVTEPITIEHFPELVGKNSMDEHFFHIGMESAQPYLKMAEKFASRGQRMPRRPDASEWVFEPHWTRYEENKEPVKVPSPLEDELVFDVEVMYKNSPYAVICTCVSSEAWYGWVSPFLVNYSQNTQYNDWEHLIPFDTQERKKLMVGYNVSYDRARVVDEYNVKQSQAFYLDAMALHVASSGICSQQRPKWLKHNKLELLVSEDDDEFGIDDDDDYDRQLSAADIANELIEDPWLKKGSPNSLANVARFHCNIDIDKTDRDFFAERDPSVVIQDFNNLMDYCAKDVEATYHVFSRLFYRFREKIPHPVSFAALRHLGALLLPTTKKWDTYIESAESCYQENREQVTKILRDRANSYVEYISAKDESLKPDWERDSWLRQLDWTIKQPRLKKNGEPMANQAFLTGYPQWYRDLFKVTNNNGVKQRELNISVRTRITPLLLKLKWEGYPLLWTDSEGWCFKVPYDEEVILSMEQKNYAKAKLSEEEFESFLSELRDGNNFYELFKVYHPGGPKKRCTSVLAKGYLKFFDQGVLSSEYGFAKDIVKLNAVASYWTGNRLRIMDQFVVYADQRGGKNKFFKDPEELRKNSDMGIILPKLCTMGTITRRATENTWLTASNINKERIGSELKAMVEAPEGYVFVGADVDSEELWIASLVGDSSFGIHGGTALGWMTLEGNKNERTDLHSKTADILGILRNDAKIFNYGRIYGAGVKFATLLLKQCNTSLSDQEAENMAQTLYAKTKGFNTASRFLDRRLFHGGIESVMFNALEAIANQENPRTPVLGAAITNALSVANLNKNNYLTSRINWVIQSSGVDYLHLLIVSMEHLTRRYNVDARLVLTVHDELRYLVKVEDRYKAALLLQISNLWTRAMFCEQVGINEVPQTCAFFSEVDIDHVLRKEVSLDCVTPSHSTLIPPGESVNIHELLKKVDLGFLKQDDVPMPPEHYGGRQKVLAEIDRECDEELKVIKVRLQNSTNKNEWRKNISAYIKRLKCVHPDKYQDFTSASKKGHKSEVKMPLRQFKVVQFEDYDLSEEGDELLAQEVAQSTPEYENASHQSFRGLSSSSLGDFGAMNRFPRRGQERLSHQVPQKLPQRHESLANPTLPFPTTKKPMRRRPDLNKDT